MTDAHSRKKLQNRVAQQKYRQNLKTRIANLERRAAAADATRVGKAVRPGPPVDSPLIDNPVALQPLNSNVPPLSQRQREQASHVSTISPVWASLDGQQQYERPSYQADRWSVASLTVEVDGLGYASVGHSLDNRCADATSVNDNNVQAVGAAPAWFEPAKSLFANEHMNNEEYGFAQSEVIHQHSHSNHLNPTYGSTGPYAEHRDRSHNPRVAEKPHPMFTTEHATTAPSSPATGDSSRPHQQTDLQMRSILNFVQLQGFEDFDAVVSQYYTGVFEKGSAVHNAQRLSRSRGLPSLLRDLRASVKKWSRWEAKGYEEEILRTAEIVLGDEIDSSISESQACSLAKDLGLSVWLLTARSVLAQQALDTPCNTRRCLADELPNLWAFIASFERGESSTSRNRSCVLSAVILAVMRQHALQ